MSDNFTIVFNMCFLTYAVQEFIFLEDRLVTFEIHEFWASRFVIMYALITTFSKLYVTVVSKRFRFCYYCVRSS
jgi:hypothetical protein